MSSEQSAASNQLFQLNDSMSAIANASPDPIARAVSKALGEFALSEVAGEKYFWKYLPDEAFGGITKKIQKSRTNVRLLNRILISHLEIIYFTTPVYR